MVAAFVEYYNHQRLHSAIGFIAPADMLAGRAETIWARRDQKLETARARRRELRQHVGEKTASQDAPGSMIGDPAKPYPGSELAIGVH